MSRKKIWVLLSFVAVTAFIVGYGGTAKAWHARWYGYFYETYDTSGLEVLPPWGGPSGCAGNGNALPTWVDTPGEFVNFMVCKLSGTTQNRRGAAFIISTMAGTPRYVSPGSAEINEFSARVHYAYSQGWMNFGASVGCITPNTYYQDSGNGDVAWYTSCGASGPGVTVYHPNGNYIIKRFCANPVGDMAPLPDDLNFTMTGTSTVNDNTVLPNQDIVFRHNLRNAGPTGTGGNTIDWGTWGGPSPS